ncbi:MAG: peptidylprolyl isomerase [Dehalococcoidia bacterium]
MRTNPSYTLSLFALLVFSAASGPGLACSSPEESTRPESSATEAGQTDAPAQPPVEQKTVDPESFPEVVARVGATEITKVDVIERAKAVRARMKTDISTVDFYRKVLDEMIGAELLHQAALSKGYAASETEVSGQLDAVRSRFPNEAAFTQELSNQGLSLEKLKVMMAKDMSIDKFIRAEIAPRASVSEAEKKKFYEENSEKMKRPEQARVSHILVKVEPEAPPEARAQAKKKAEDLRRRVEAGEEFAAVARESSDDPGTKAQGGNLSWVSRGQTVPAFEEAAFALKPDEMSGVVETQFGYHIIKLFERKPAESIPYEEAQARIESFLTEQRLQEEVRAEVAALRAKAKVEILI